MLEPNKHQDFQVFNKCPVCDKKYDEVWKVVNHIKKDKGKEHLFFLKQNEDECFLIYKNNPRQKLHEKLFEANNIFCGMSFNCINRSVIKKHFSETEREENRRKRISKTMSEAIKTPEHNLHVSEGVSQAWKDGKYDGPEIQENKRIGYTNRKSFAGENNPMYGKPCPKVAGRGKGGIREDIGHYVRSTWEANICRIYQLFQRTYEYEKKRFYFEIDGVKYSYCPDLFLPDKNLYLEIKGHAKASNNWICPCATCIKNRKMIKEVQEKNNVKIIIIGKEEYNKFKRKFKNKITWEK
jgi:hypothetical protein